MQATELSAREGKTLRFVVSNNTPPTTPERCIVSIEWSDLPKTLLQARATLEKLSSVDSWNSYIRAPLGTFEVPFLTFSVGRTLSSCSSLPGDSIDGEVSVTTEG